MTDFERQQELVSRMFEELTEENKEKAMAYFEKLKAGGDNLPSASGSQE